MLHPIIQEAVDRGMAIRTEALLKKDARNRHFLQLIAPFIEKATSQGVQEFFCSDIKEKGPSFLFIPIEEQFLDALRFGGLSYDAVSSYDLKAVVQMQPTASSYQKLGNVTLRVFWE